MTQLSDLDALSGLVRSGLDDGAFMTYFQPKFDPDSEEVVSLEAFLRWQHPEEGFREAGWFLPAVERSPELIKNVDSWVLNETMRLARLWQDGDLPFGLLNVNVSSWTVGAELVGMVETALKNSGFPAKSLALECPWRMLAADLDVIKPTMDALTRLGCTIVLDGNPLDQDCLDQVRKTPVKLSKVCIKHIQEYSEAHGTRALSSIIKNWQKRGVQIVSMGVESDEQLELSHKVGCKFSQGNRFKSALPSEEITVLLRMIERTKRALSLI